MTITKELLELKIIEATKKRDSHITAANGAIAEINAYSSLLADLDAPAEPEAATEGESAGNDNAGNEEGNTESPAEVA